MRQIPFERMVCRIHALVRMVRGCLAGNEGVHGHFVDERLPFSVPCVERFGECLLICFGEREYERQQLSASFGLRSRGDVSYDYLDLMKLAHLYRNTFKDIE